MICKPEAVVMGFPAVWAAAVAGIKAGITKDATATAAKIGIVARGKHRIFQVLLIKQKRV
jgi:hypothetical protein